MPTMYDGGMNLGFDRMALRLFPLLDAIPEVRMPSHIGGLELC